MGGRVLSLRSPFAPGHSVEAGAARIPPEHGLTLEYARHFGLALDRFYPVPLLSSIRFSPALSSAKTEAMNGGFRYQSATRVFVRFRTRFWEGENLNGWGTTDWPEELWHPTWDAPGAEGVLLTYVRGALANELDGLDGDARVARVLAHWEEFLPGASSHFTSGTSHSWQLDPWSRAAWASPTPTQDRELGSALARPEGPIHFAGEHVSGARGWMNGALESGLRAVMEIDSG